MWELYTATKRTKAKQLLTYLVGKMLDKALKEIFYVGLESMLLEVDGIPQSKSTVSIQKRMVIVINAGVVKDVQIG